MNIFYLDKDPVLAAQYHHDKHVVKMVLETAQLLSTAHHVFNSSQRQKVYKPAFKNHPCAMWVRASVNNYDWAYQLFLALLEEYTYRYNKQHACAKLVEFLKVNPCAELNANLKSFQRPLPVNSTQPALAVPLNRQLSHSRQPNPRYDQKSAIHSYRNYYVHDKLSQSKYTKRETPHWISTYSREESVAVPPPRPPTYNNYETLERSPIPVRRSSIRRAESADIDAWFTSTLSED